MTAKESFLDTLTKEADIVRALTESMDMDSMREVMEMLMNCEGVIGVAGCGTSGAAATKIVHTLSCVQCPAMFMSPANANHGEMGAIREGDIVILISKGGKTNELQSMIAPCQSRGAKVIVVTENEASPMGLAADKVLKIKVKEEPDDYNILATGSTMAVIAVFDAIAIGITRARGFSKEEFLRIHPGGDVGKRLAKELS